MIEACARKLMVTYIQCTNVVVYSPKYDILKFLQIFRNYIKVHTSVPAVCMYVSVLYMYICLLLIYTCRASAVWL